MKFLILAPVALLLAFAGPASAQDAEDAFSGFKVGGAVDYRRNEAKYAVPGLPDRLSKQEGGVGYRVHAGYDALLGGNFLIGAEAGVGGGGKTLQRSSAAGEYRLKPGLSYDASARAGVLVTDTVLLYGRAGYQWLRTRENVRFTAAGVPARKDKDTARGLMYGFGAEFAVSPQAALRAEFDQTRFGHGLKAAQVQLGGVVRF